MKNACSKFAARTKKVELLGAGTYGEAWRVSVDGTHADFVEKVFLKISKNIEEITSEVQVYTVCTSEAIPQMLFCGFNSDGQWCMILQLIDGGILSSHLEALKDLPEAQKIIAFELARGLEYLHSQFFTHG